MDEKEAEAINHHLTCIPPLKRLRDEDMDYSNDNQYPVHQSTFSIDNKDYNYHHCYKASTSRWFILIESGKGIYESEVYSQRDETLYIPIRYNVLINMKNIEQITFGSGTYFIGDLQGRFTDTVPGKQYSLRCVLTLFITTALNKIRTTVSVIIMHDAIE